MFEQSIYQNVPNVWKRRVMVRTDRYIITRLARIKNWARRGTCGLEFAIAISHGVKFQRTGMALAKNRTQHGFCWA